MSRGIKAEYQCYQICISERTNEHECNVTITDPKGEEVSWYWSDGFLEGHLKEAMEAVDKAIDDPEWNGWVNNGGPI